MFATAGFHGRSKGFPHLVKSVKGDHLVSSRTKVVGNGSRNFVVCGGADTRGG